MTGGKRLIKFYCFPPRITNTLNTHGMYLHKSGAIKIITDLEAILLDVATLVSLASTLKELLQLVCILTEYRIKSRAANHKQFKRRGNFYCRCLERTAAEAMMRKLMGKIDLYGSRAFSTCIWCSEFAHLRYFSFPESDRGYSNDHCNGRVTGRFNLGMNRQSRISWT
ncbi:uncharacterized protein EI90DRAFT_2414825 [Cantharellus anzutake]|uniref:uncharacterized protein n=1 Tax=Cantharellus anzutake TaxID=1750568 RepID=UPI0019052E27|nr:uncharacterized protein EI90DRAFT_2414825 [Cantharellus anzutake]KAF8338786.1 hypothetical protein EI90DRAFT_2414825 [Cantharellus anzutake]